MPILTITAQKGGCAKTTTVQALAQAWCSDHAREKAHCLLVDGDPQGNLTDVLDVDNPPQGVLDAILGENPGQHVVHVSDWVDLLPAGESLINADMTLLRQDDGMGYLAKTMEALAPAYDLVIIDTPPSLGAMTVSALLAATHAVLVTKPDRLSLAAVTKTFDAIESVRRNKKIDIAGLIMTMVDPRLRVDKAGLQVATEICASYGIPILGGVTNNAALRECQANRQPISPAITAMQDYITIYHRLKGKISHE